MTKREYQELREFLAVRFDAMDQRFDALEERLIRIELLAEENHHQMRMVAERIVSLQKTMTEGRKAGRSEMAEEFGAVCSELRSVRPGNAASLDAQGRLLRVLGNRVGPLKA